MTDLTTFVLVNIIGLIALIVFWPLQRKAQQATDREKHFWLVGVALLDAVVFLSAAATDGIVFASYCLPLIFK